MYIAQKCVNARKWLNHILSNGFFFMKIGSCILIGYQKSLSLLLACPLILSKFVCKSGSGFSNSIFVHLTNVSRWATYMYLRLYYLILLNFVFVVCTLYTYSTCPIVSLRLCTFFKDILYLVFGRKRRQFWSWREELARGQVSHHPDYRQNGG